MSLGNSEDQVIVKNEHITKDTSQEYFYYTSYKISYSSFDNAVKATFSDDYVKNI